MLKQEVKYHDFDGNEVTETHYFNLSADEIVENIEIQEELQFVYDLLSGITRELTPKEIKPIYEIVKKFVKLSHGVRSDDGRRFRKDAETWNDFVETNAFSGFVMSLFEPADKAFEFIIKVMPADLIQKVKDAQGEPIPGLEDIPVAPDKTPKDMTREELVAAFLEKNQASE